MVPRENKNNACAMLGGTNKEYYGIFRSGLYVRLRVNSRFQGYHFKNETVVHKNIDEYHEHLNKQNTSIQLTREIKQNGKIPFLDCLATSENNTLRITVYRKQTHTDRLLDQTSDNPTSHKATTIRTLTRRAQIVCNSDDTNHVNT